MFTKTNRTIAAAAAASIALTTLTLAPAAAAPFYGPGLSAPAGVTEVGYRRHGGGAAAALGAFAAIAGTIASIAAAEHYRHRYYDGPYPYAYEPAYPYGYAPNYGWDRWHHRW